MPAYDYKCVKCSKVFTGYSNISTRNDPQECDCGGEAERHPESELNHAQVCIPDKERWSLSMAVNPHQIPEAMKAYPGSEYHPKTGRLKIRNRRHKLQELKRRNLEEMC